MKKLGIMFLVSVVLCPGPALAAGAAQALYGVKEVVVHAVHFADPTSSNDCGLSGDDILAALKQDLQAVNIPFKTEADAKTEGPGIARVNLIPEAVTINEGLECRTWASISVETDNKLDISPVDMLRNVKVIYWHQGSLITGPQAVHQKSLLEIYKKMVAALAKQYADDQQR
jgi:hypothetical protein